MAKQIKAIKCPNCGSTKKTEIKTDHYLCSNCNSEYFLDNDDINVNINHRTTPPPPPIQRTNSKNWGVASIVFVVLLFFIFGVRLCSNKIGGSKKEGSQKTFWEENKKKEADKCSYRYERSTLINNNGKLIIFSLVEKEYGRSNAKDIRNGLYCVFRDLVSQKLIKEEKIDISTKSLDCRSRYFESINKNYFILNKRFLYEVNAADATFADVTKEVFIDQPELESGIASLEFGYENYGDNFKLMSNMGKEYYYYPAIKKVYKKDGFYSFIHGFRTLLPNAKDVTYYTFSGESNDYPDELRQLLSITYKYNNGGPEDKTTSPSWRKAYAYSGIIYDNTPYTKRLIDKDWHRVVNYKDITPGRVYFSPSVLYYNDAEILIQFRANAAPDAPTTLQLLKTNGDITWSLPSEKRYRKENLVANDNYFAIKIQDREFALIDRAGKEIKIVELEDNSY